MDFPRKLIGSFRPPGDKSISHRALLLASLASGTSRLSGLNPGVDVASSRAILEQLGAVMTEEGGDSRSLRVEGCGGRFRSTGAPLDCGNSGTTMRLFAGALAGAGGDHLLVGDASLSRRPMERVVDPLRRMGARIETADGGRAPLRIRDALLSPLAMPEPVRSAQVKSAILLAALAAEGRTTLIEASPSRDHTERMLGGFGARVVREGFVLSLEGPVRLAARDLVIPGDPSAAAFALAGAAMLPGSKVEALGLSVNPTRRTIFDLLERMGARVRESNRRDEQGEPVADVTVEAAEWKGIEIRGDETAGAIDELLILGVVAARASGRTTVADAGELRVKESDRIAGLVTGLRLLGAAVEERPDGFVIEGKGPEFRFRAARVDALGDHRLAMAFRIASLAAAGPVGIDGAESIVISDPEFEATLGGLLG